MIETYSAVIRAFDLLMREKLDANESPWPLPPEARARIASGNVCPVGDLGDVGRLRGLELDRNETTNILGPVELRYGVSYHDAKVSDLVLVGPDGELVERWQSGEGLKGRLGPGRRQERLDVLVGLGDDPDQRAHRYRRPGLHHDAPQDAVHESR